MAAGSASALTANCAARPTASNGTSLISRWSVSCAEWLSETDGKRYQTQYKDELDQPSWIDLGEPSTATGEQASALCPAGDDPCRFFRVVELSREECKPRASRFAFERKRARTDRLEMISVD